MAEPKLAAARQWPQKAKRDLAAAERLTTEEAPLLDIAVYHCQQAVEKALKAFLTFHEVPFEKTHNLVALLDLAEKIDADLRRWLETAKRLTPYATEFRYLSEPLVPEEREATEALNQARAFVQDLEKRLPQR